MTKYVLRKQSFVCVLEEWDGEETHLHKACGNTQTVRPVELVNDMSSFPSCQNGNTALAIARRLGYISVVDTLKVVTEEIMTTTVSSWGWTSPPRNPFLLDFLRPFNKEPFFTD